MKVMFIEAPYPECPHKKRLNAIGQKLLEIHDCPHCNVLTDCIDTKTIRRAIIRYYTTYPDYIWDSTILHERGQ